MDLGAEPLSVYPTTLAIGQFVMTDNEDDFGRYTMSINAANTSFHRDYWEHLARKHPRIYMTPPKNKGSYSNWILMKGHDFPKGVRFHHKLDQQVLELGFDGRNIEEIFEKKSDWPEDIRVVQKGKTASLMIKVPSVDMKIGVGAQLDAIEKALQAAYRLMPYSSLFSRAT